MIFNPLKKVLYGLLLTSTSIPLWAAVITENALSFGQVVIVDNSVVSTVTIDLSDGKTRTTKKMLVLVPGHLGEFTLLSFQPYTEVDISVSFLSAESASVVGSAEQFTLTNLTTEPKVTIDEHGIATIYVGGTLSTSGNGNNGYTNTSYLGSFNLVISY